MRCRIKILMGPAGRFRGMRMVPWWGTILVSAVHDQGDAAARRRGSAIAPDLRPWGGPGRARADPHALSPPLISQALPATRPVLYGAVFLGVTIVPLPAAASRSALRAVACDRLRRT
jgi:hypothetical protein